MTDWLQTSERLEKTFAFADFETAMKFMQDAAPLISTLGHHPEWSNTYNKVFVRLTTHDAGNQVTEKDRKLAKLLDELYGA
jgi:4a-hydroxytetrahydrobiopterin dehydratase